MNVRYSPRARADLVDILEYIAADNREAARRVSDAILRAIDLIARRPYVGIRNARSPRLRSRLALPYPYRVHYTVEGGEIWIVHIRHAAREPWPSE